MKLLTITRSDENISEMTDLTHPIIENYAKRCNSDFKILSDSKDLHKHYRILQVYDYFNDYDRILILDSDMLILKSCPNLFEIVPEDYIGTIFEDKGTRQKDRRERIKKANKFYGDIGWRKGYINTGCFITSKQHRDIFKGYDVLWNNLGYDDVYLGYQINKLGFKIYELPFTFNHMTMYSENWNSNANRFDSYIIHYAGQGLFIPAKNRTELIKQDYYFLKKYSRV